jgi:hypothetical protein
MTQINPSGTNADRPSVVPENVPTTKNQSVSASDSSEAPAKAVGDQVQISQSARSASKLTDGVEQPDQEDSQKTGGLSKGIITDEFLADLRKGRAHRWV